jgi:hypothetical protein
MNSQLNSRALAASSAIAGAIINALCFAIYLLVGRPDPWMQLFIGSGPTVGGWIIGMAEGAAVFALGGVVIGFCYNRFAHPAV